VVSHFPLPVVGERTQSSSTAPRATRVDIRATIFCILTLLFLVGVAEAAGDGNILALVFLTIGGLAWFAFAWFAFVSFDVSSVLP
jgi:hypothetical protein